MKTLLILALLFVTPFTLLAAEDDDGLSSAIESLRDAEAEPSDDREEEHDEDHEDDHDDFDWDESMESVTGAELKAALEKYYGEQLGWMKKIRDEEFLEEAEEILEHLGRETVVIARHEPDGLDEHLTITRAELTVEFYTWRLHETDDPLEQIGPKLIKAMKTVKQVQMDNLKREVEHLKAELEEIEGWDVEAEVQEMMEDR